MISGQNQIALIRQSSGVYHANPDLMNCQVSIDTIRKPPRTQLIKPLPFQVTCHNYNILYGLNVPVRPAWFVSPSLVEHEAFRFLDLTVASRMQTPSCFVA